MERREKIMQLLSTHKSMNNEELCRRMFCSVSTLRRELIQLEEDGLVKRVRGGVMLVTGTGFDFSSQVRENTNVAQKQYIAEIAKDFLANGMSLFLDASSTALKLCPILNRLHNITVVTNGITTAIQLNHCDHINTFITGGQLRKGNASLLGETSSSYISNFKADIAFISCRGLCSDGVFEADIEHSLIKRHMLQNAEKRILLADSSKFGEKFFHRLCQFSELDAIITDKEPNASILKAIDQAGIEIIY